MASAPHVQRCEATLPDIDEDPGMARGAAGTALETSGDFSGLAELRRVMQQWEAREDSLLCSSQTWSPHRQAGRSRDGGGAASRRDSFCSITFSEVPPLLGERKVELEDPPDSLIGSQASSQIPGSTKLVKSGVDFAWPCGKHENGVGSLQGTKDVYSELAKTQATCAELRRELAACRFAGAANADEGRSATSVEQQLRLRARERLALLHEVAALRTEAKMLMRREEDNWRQHVENYQGLAAQVLLLQERLEKSRCQRPKQEEREARASHGAKEEQRTLRTHCREQEVQPSPATAADGEQVPAASSSGAKEELHNGADAQESFLAREKRLEQRCEAHESEIEALKAQLARCSSERPLAEESAAALQEVERQCEAGEQRLDKLERWFREQADRNAATVRLVRTEFQEAQVAWTDRLRKEEALRHEAEEARREADLRVEQAQAAVAQVEVALRRTGGT